MFWTDWGNNAKIELAHMDGTNRKTIVTQNLEWPNGLAIDRPAGRLYWNDAKLRTIESSDLNGQNRKIIINEVPHPYGLVVVGSHVYWTDWQTKALHRADKRNGNDKVIIRNNLNGLMDVRSVQSDNIAENACGSNNGGCSHLCLRNTQSYTCACPTGIKMIKEKTCGYQPSTYLLFTSQSALARISLDTKDMWDVTLPIKNIHHAIGIDFHWGEQLIFYSDVKRKKIASVNMRNLSEVTDIVTTNLSAPNGLAVDWIANNLYWTDTTNKVIEVSKINGMYRKILVSENIQEPRSLAVFPRKGYLFWSDWGEKPKIERSFLDGSNRKVLIDKELGFPNGLLIDYKAKRLYWADAKLDRIETSDLNGRNRILIHGVVPNIQSTHPFDLAQVIFLK